MVQKVRHIFRMAPMEMHSLQSVDLIAEKWINPDQCTANVVVVSRRGWKTCYIAYISFFFLKHLQWTLFEL